MRRREELAEAAYAFSQRLAASGAGYAALIFNPTHWKHWHGRLPQMLDALDAGFGAAEQDGLPPVGLGITHAVGRRRGRTGRPVGQVASSTRRGPVVVPSIEQYPIERLRRAGVAVSVNTDDPALLDTSLEREYALRRDTFEWSDDDPWSVARTSIDASFANDDVKTRLRDVLGRR